MERRTRHKGPSVATVRMSDELHDEIREEAHRLRISQNELMVSMMEPLLRGRDERKTGGPHVDE